MVAVMFCEIDVFSGETGAIFHHLSGTGMLTDQLGWLNMGVHVGKYSSPRECLGLIG